PTLCANYLGDEGSSGVPYYSFQVPAGATFVIVVHEVAATGCASYTLQVVGNNPACDPTATPTPTCPPALRVVGPNNPGKVGAYPVTISNISIAWPAQGTTTYTNQLSDQIARLLIYADADGDGDPSNAVLLGQELVQVGAVNVFQSYPVNVTVPGPAGDIYLGF